MNCSWRRITPSSSDLILRYEKDLSQKLELTIFSVSFACLSAKFGFRDESLKLVLSIVK